jgi:hypothetical protein
LSLDKVGHGNLLPALVLLLSTSLSAEDVIPEYGRLSGTWTGTYSWLQRGSCSLHKSARLDSQVEVTARVNSNGALEAQVTSLRVIRDIRHADVYSEFPVPGDPGYGQFRPDLTFDLKAPIRTKCHGSVRQSYVDYKGKVTEAKGELRMEFDGDFVPCDKSPKCRFKGSVRLKKK